MRNNKLSDRVRLLHIIDAILDIELYLTNLTRDEFLSNSLVKSATLMQIVIIGEAAANLSAETKNLNKKVAWRQIKGTRNIITHEYFGIDYEIVWNIARQELPALKEQIQQTLRQMEE